MIERFAAPPDALTRRLTRLVWSLAFASAVMVWWVLIGDGVILAWTSAASLVVPLAVLAAFAPRAYAITEHHLEVRRLVGPLRFPLTDLRAVRALRPGELGAMRRTFGVGGFYGYFGRFHSQHLGELHYHLSTRSWMILVERAGHAPLVLSPEPAKRFVQVLVARIEEGLNDR